MMRPTALPCRGRTSGFPAALRTAPFRAPSASHRFSPFSAQPVGPRPRALATLLAVWCLVTATAGGTAGAQDAAQKVTYDDHIKPLLATRCSSCHNPNERKSGLDITNYTNLMEGGASGAVVEPGDLDFSRLFALVSHDEEPVMPPDMKLPDDEIELIRRWVEGGALENQGSTAPIPKPQMEVAGSDNPQERPEHVAMPPRLSLQPHAHTDQATVARSIAVSPWAPLAAVAGHQQVLLYHTESLQLLGVLPFAEGTVNTVRFSPNGSLLLAAGGHPGASGKVVLWDVATGERVAEVGSEIDAILAADITADHARVAVGTSQRTAKVFSTKTGEVLYELSKPTDWVTSVAFSPDGVLLATGDRAGGLTVWEGQTGREYLTLKGHTGAITSLSWRGDSNVLASASEDATVRLWEMENGGQIKSWGAHPGGTIAVDFNRAGQILSTGRDRVTKLWDQSGKQLKAFPAADDLPVAAAWCDETQRALAGDATGNVRVWESAEGKQLALWTDNPPLLQQRLAQSQQQQQAAAQPLPDLEKQLQGVTAQAQAAQEQLTATQTALTQAQQKVEAVAARIQSTTAQKTALDQQHQQVTTQLTTAQQAKPLLDAALGKLLEALQVLASDAGLQQEADQLAERTKALEQQVGTWQTELESLQTQISTSASQLDTANQEMAQAQQEQQALTAQADAQTKALQPLVQQQQQAQAALDQARAAAEARQADVARWQAEIEFAGQLQAIRTQLDAAQQAVAEKSQSLQQAQEAMTAAETQLGQARQEMQAAETQREALFQQLLQTKQVKR